MCECECGPPLILDSSCQNHAFSSDSGTDFAWQLLYNKRSLISLSKAYTSTLADALFYEIHLDLSKKRAQGWSFKVNFVRSKSSHSMAAVLVNMLSKTVGSLFWVSLTVAESG